MNRDNSGGVGILTVVGIVLVVLKLTHQIDWSWWWVLLPFYGGILLWLIVFAIVAALWSWRR